MEKEFQAFLDLFGKYLRGKERAGHTLIDLAKRRVWVDGRGEGGKLYLPV